MQRSNNRRSNNSSAASGLKLNLNIFQIFSFASCERIPELAEVNGFFSEDEVTKTFVCLPARFFPGGEVQAKRQGVGGGVGQGNSFVQTGMAWTIYTPNGHLDFSCFSVRDVHKHVGSG